MKSGFGQYSIAFILLFCSFFCRAQSINLLGQYTGTTVNTNYVAPLFLLIAPDARANGIGNTGSATSPDENSTYWNPSKLAFIKDTLGLSVSYMPWLWQIVPNILGAYLSAYYKLNQNQAIGLSLKYFSLNGLPAQTGSFNPNEYALDITCARRISDCLSLALTARYIYANTNEVLYSYKVYPNQQCKSAGVDISAYYQSHTIIIFKKPSTFTAGLNISNIGPKMRFSDSSACFLPTNLRLGMAYSIDFDNYNKLTFMFDLDKLLVPTPPIYLVGKNGKDSIINGDKIIVAGINPNVSVLRGMGQSFFDAPGGFRKQLDEIDICSGIEYWYMKQYALRTGLFYESSTNGDRQYVTAGAGFRLKIIEIDASYLIPVTQQSPLQNTLYLSLAMHIK